jgi:hypothetical protein
MEGLENIIVSLTKEYLEVAKIVDSKLMEGGAAHNSLLEYRKANPDVSFEELKPRLVELFKNHQRSTLLMKDVESLVNRLSVLKTLIDLSGIKIDLDEEDQTLLKGVVESSKLFYSAKQGELVPLQEEVINNFLTKTAEKGLTDQSLLEMFNTLK